MSLIVLTSCELKENSEKAANNSEKAALTSEQLYYANQAGGSEASRKEAVTAMKESKEFDHKARYAVSFMKALSSQTLSQVHKTAYFDYNQYREAVLLDDVKIVRRLAKEFMGNNREFKVTNVKGNNGNIKALAAALHYNHPICEAVAARQGYTCQSMHDIIKEAFYLYYVEGKKPSQLKDYQRAIVRRSGREAFLYMLELRVKFLPLIAIAQISKIKKSLYSKVKMIIGDWEPDYESSDAVSEILQEGNDKYELAVDSVERAKFKENVFWSELKNIENELAEVEKSIEGLERAGERNEMGPDEFDEQYEILDKKQDKLFSKQAKVLQKVAKAKIKYSKYQEKADKIDEDYSTREAPKTKKALIQDANVQQKKLNYLDASDEDFQYFSDVIEKAVEDRDFLRSIKITKGVGRYKIQVPLRNADLPGIVVRLLNNMDLSELRSASGEELESVGYKSRDIDSFLNTVDDLKNNAYYIKPVK